MGKIFATITDDLREWIEQQKVFFVATAPLSQEGHINCSPKGLDSFRILSPVSVAYQDLTGSGVETIAHINENKRIVILFCAFDGPPKIVRLHGKAEVVYKNDDRFQGIDNRFPEREGTRAYIYIHLTRISDSCGYGVPLYDFKSDRDVMPKWEAAKGETGLIAYRKEKNALSIDGLKGFASAENT